MEDKSKYSKEQMFGHFLVARSVLWLIPISSILSAFCNEIVSDTMRKYVPACYQFYVLFSIYAHVQLIEGLKYVSKSRRKKAEDLFLIFILRKFPKE